MLVKLYNPPEETETAGGIILSQRTIEREVEFLQRAQILTIGPGCTMPVKERDFVLLERFSGTYVPTGDGDPAGAAIIVEDCIVAIVDSAYAKKELGLDKPAKK